VAGLIATYLAYDQKPWDDSKQGVERVKAIRDYLTTDSSSWVRKAGSDVRMIWSGAAKEQHESAGANNAGSPPHTTPGPVKGKALSIILQSMRLSQDRPGTAPFINRWLFLSVNRGETPNCKPDGESLVKPLPSAGGKDKVPHAELPGREELHFEGSLSSCEYLNDGKGNPGKLWCGGTGFDCFFETQKEQDCSNGFPGDLWQQPKVHCEWSD
jgi:hypothetical protein